MDKEGLNQHRKYCVGMALKKKLSEDKEKRMDHQRCDVIKPKKIEEE